MNETESTAAVSRPSAFVIMPFDCAEHKKGKRGPYPPRNRSDLDKLFDLIKLFLEREGYVVRRSDSAGNILESIVHDIHKSSIIVAILTGLNPNVMYELGIAHGLRKKTILLTEEITELPFDLKGYNCLKYEYGSGEKHKAFGRDIKKLIEKISSGEQHTFGPVETHLQISDYSVSLYEKRVCKRRLETLFREVSALTIGQVTLLSLVCNAADHKIHVEKDWVKLDVKNIVENTPAELWDETKASVDQLTELSWCLRLMVTENYLLDEYVSIVEREAILSYCHTLLTTIAINVRLTSLRIIECASIGCVLKRDLSVILSRINSDPKAFETKLWAVGRSAKALLDLEFAYLTPDMAKCFDESKDD